MKIARYKIPVFIMAIAMSLSMACVEVDGLVTPNVASPVLVMLQGTAFAPTSTVTVGSTILELDKTNILDHTKGIDSLPVSNLVVKVMINNTEEVGSITTDNMGKALFEATWQQLGLTTASVGRQVRLEFTGVHKNTAFRKYHTVRVN